MKEAVVVYYSRTGNTRRVAGQLAALLDADLEEIREAKNRAGFFGWFGAGRDAMLKRAVVLTRTPSVAGRKTVVVGMPVWAFGPPPAVRVWLGGADLAGKKVAAFCTFDGSGGEKALNKAAALVPGGLAARLGLKKPAADPNLAVTLQAWAGTIAGGK